jgi:hypothetical protein
VLSASRALGKLLKLIYLSVSIFSADIIKNTFREITLMGVRDGLVYGNAQTTALVIYSGLKKVSFFVDFYNIYLVIIFSLKAEKSSLHCLTRRCSTMENACIRKFRWPMEVLQCTDTSWT